MSPYVPLNGDVVVGSDASVTAATATSPILNDGNQHAQEVHNRPVEENACAQSDTPMLKTIQAGQQYQMDRWEGNQN